MQKHTCTISGKHISVELQHRTADKLLPHGRVEGMSQKCMMQLHAVTGRQEKHELALGCPRKAEPHSACTSVLFSSRYVG